MQDLLKARWDKFNSVFKLNASTSKKLWSEIVHHYDDKNRAYHNLEHLEDLFQKMDMYKNELSDKKAIAFSIWYHDIIYNPLSKKNEEKSAAYCIKRLQEIGLSLDFQQKVFKLICSTKTHTFENWKQDADKTDNAFLLDFDLSILGSDPKTYEDYVAKIRKEYKRVPSILYKPGRKKVLQHFLEKDRIFKTDLFYQLYEKKARENIQAELERF